jgi:hypothetical protein
MKITMILLSVACLYGTTYYVSVSGNDLWPGTNPDSAWRHINHACSTVVAGDTVLVLPGLYQERVLFIHSGSTGQKIVFKSHPRRSTTTWGFDTNSPNAGSYTRIEGFNIVWDTTLTSWRDFGIYIASDNVEVVDNYISNFRKTAIQGRWSQPWPRNIYIVQNKVFHCQMGIGVQGTNWIIEDNEIERLFYYRPGDCDYTRFFGDSIIFRHNYFHGTDPDSIGTAHVDCFQTFDNNGEYARYVVIDGNYGFDFAQGFMGEAHFYHNSHHITFKNNIFARGWAWGLCVQDIANVRAFNNTFAYIQWHGIGFSGQYAQNGEVRNNIFFNTGTSYWWDDTATATGDYNLIFGASPPTVVGPHDILNQDPRFVDSLNNDFRLQPNSPAINNGDSLLEVLYDIIGVSRPQGQRWDIGAYEYYTGGIADNNYKDTGTKERIRIAPNPFSEFTMVIGSPKKEFVVYDATGRRIKIYKNSRIGADLNPGVYFVRNSNQYYCIVKIR